ncbi:MAG: DNA polymerase III subunit beta [Candidatus Margulisbacteria bacterium]|jgi:DNA polymerase-3 subunit beta|nr:DNA polymerase III subunit beta [Candidatus Margulisiibacteriota bacterium]
MEFKCVKADLHDAIQIVEKAVSLRSTLPIIGNILLEAGSGGLKLSSNDLEIGIELLLDAEVTQEGAVLAPAKTLSSIIAKLSDGEVSFQVDSGNNILINAGRSKFNIHGLATDDFPALHKLTGGEKINIEADVLREMIRQTIIAVSLDEAKQFLNGILVEKEKQELRFVATDGFRLAKKVAVLSEANSAVLSIIIPSRALQEISRILQQEDYQGVVEIVVTREQISFKFKRLYFLSRLIQGQFPDYRQVIPKEQKTRIILARQDLLEAADRASIIASASANIIKLEMVEQKLLITASTSSIGNVSELVDIQKEGENMQPIAFNVRLILDVIKNIAEDSVVLTLNGSLSPGVIAPKDSKDFTYVVMPIRTPESK